jgi:hypothetical protein
VNRGREQIPAARFSHAVLIQLDSTGRDDPVLTDGSSEMERELVGITRQYGLELLARHQLEQPVTFRLEKTSPARTRMFNVLFSDTDFLPVGTDAC